MASLSFFASPRPDSTILMLTVSLANRVLAFKREGDHYKADYQIAFEASQGGRRVIERVRDESVRVLAFRETTRSDESVLFRQYVTVAPGTYEMRLTVRNNPTGTGGSAVEATVGVPQLSVGTVSSPVPMYNVVPRERRNVVPQLLATPRSTAIFGRDSVVPLYVEGYGPPDGGQTFPVKVRAMSDAGGGVLWSDSVNLPLRGELYSGIISVPVSHLGVGVVSVGVSRAGSADTVRTPVFIAFGEDLPVATFNEMIDYLRYYASISRLQALRGAAAERRANAWAQFLRETDPNPGTTEHEGLREYFGRVAQANVQFREDGSAGWMTDRGRVFVTLGRPDQIFEPNVADMSQRGRTQIWDYREHRLQLLFIDQTGFGRWRMTPTSELEFEGVMRRILH
ncbi:MAG TPA: GWxTD domain-containing protein [Gemmatimonadaceae bacterium]|nr:GWxTD domain-containing protein [Gemmatimonadaceae bacterium]